MTVFRRNESIFCEVSCEKVVPGDVIFISKDDIIPADMRIIFANNLKVDQSIFGENFKIRKKESTYHDEDIGIESILDIPDLCFMGTKVVAGQAKGLIINTGKATYLGHLLLL